MSDFKVGDRVVAVKDGMRFAEGGAFFKKGDTGTIVEIDGNVPNIQFDHGAGGFCGDGLWWASRDKIKLIEPRKASAQDEIRRRMEKIRKHLAKIEELMSDKTPDEAQAEAKEALWYPLVPEGFGPWIEYDGSGMPVDANAVTNVLARVERMTQDFNPWGRPAKTWDWQHNSPEASKEHDIIAYCVKK